MKTKIISFVNFTKSKFLEFLKEKREIYIKESEKKIKDFSQNALIIKRIKAGFEFEESYTKPIEHQIDRLISIFLNEFEKSEFYKEFLIKIEEYYKPKLWNYPNGQSIFHYDDFPQLLNAYMYIHYFIERILQKIINDELENQLVENYIDHLINELQDKPFEMISILEIGGLELSCDEIKINQSITIKTDIKSSLNEIEEFAFLREIPEFDYNYPVILLRLNTKIYSEIHWKSLRFIQLLRLYKLGDYILNQSVIFAKTVSHPSRIDTFENPEFSIHFDRELTKKDISPLSKFINHYESILQNILEDDKFRFLAMAIERYDWALTNKQKIDRLFLSAVIGLEALYSKEKENSTTREIYSLRIAKLLSFLDKNPTEVSNYFKKAYSFRNNIVHGNTYEDNWLNEIKKLYPIILDYLRLSIIIYLSNTDLTKNQIINFIDDNLLGVNSTNNLKDRVEKIKYQYPKLFGEIPELRGWRY